MFFFFFKQKTAYEMRISDWSSDVCSSDLVAFAVSWVAIRQKGIYFVMLTLALAQMFYFFAFSMTDITGGDNGLIGIPMPPVKLFDFVILDRKSTRLNSSH